MKLRIQSDSLRLRLTDDEIAQLRTNQRLVNAIRFGPGEHQRLEYVLEFSDGGEEAAAVYENGRITIVIPGKLNKALLGAGGSIEFKQDFGNGSLLNILVERDLGRKTNKLRIERGERKPEVAETVPV
jgi:hypothetical protein